MSDKNRKLINLISFVIKKKLSQEYLNSNTDDSSYPFDGEITSLVLFMVSFPTLFSDENESNFA